MIILLLTTLLLDVGNARGLVSENCIFDLTCGHAGISCSVVMVTINAVAHVMPCYVMLCHVLGVAVSKKSNHFHGSFQHARKGTVTLLFYFMQIPGRASAN